MKLSRFNLAVALLLLAALVAICIWQSPGITGSKLNTAEIARYMDLVERVPFPPEERPRVMARLRAWARSDDGKPVYMLNLMRYHERLRPFAGAPSFSGTPRESNAYYEEKVMQMALGNGAYPTIAATTTGKNLLGHEAPLDDGDRVLVMRYPNRRAFFDLITDPAYASIAPYKFMALDVVLVPTVAEVVLPDIRFVAGAAVVALFLAVGWFRAARRASVTTRSAASIA